MRYTKKDQLEQMFPIVWLKCIVSTLSSCMVTRPICSTCFNIQWCLILPKEYVYVFCMIFRINSSCFIRHQPPDLCNGDFFLWGRNFAPWRVVHWITHKWNCAIMIADHCHEHQNEVGWSFLKTDTVVGSGCHAVSEFDGRSFWNKATKHCSSDS